MSVPLIPNYYHRNFPRGLPALLSTGWKTTSVPDVIITPETDTGVLITEMDLTVSNDLDLDSETITLTQSGNLNTNTELEFTTLTQILAECSRIDSVYMIGAAGYFKAIFDFKAPIFIRHGQTPAETLSFTISGTPTLVGTLQVTFRGHVITLDNAGFTKGQ